MRIVVTVETRLHRDRFGRPRIITRMTDLVDTPQEAAALERPPLLVREPLERFLDDHGIGAGELRAERIGEGHSNITFLVQRADARVVLRRPPRPPLPPSAHDVLREARLLRALEGTAARVPRVLAVGDDEDVLGVPFYVMEEVHGDVLTGDLPQALDAPDERRRICEELVDALVEIHAVDWRAAGLDGYGKPTGYLERQLRRFNGLWEHNKTRELPIVHEVADWLAQNLPDSAEATIVHGDFRLGNVMFGSRPPARLVSVFDWELSTIGDPLADVGYLTVTWAEPEDPADTSFANLNALTRKDGFLSREGLIARYEERSGRSISAINWYQALALWKAAVFMEGNYKRFLAGNSDDEYLRFFDTGVPALAEKAREIAHS
jgi:aminoglycoside phosphotransferase (APT) family kinase protein